MTTRERMHVGRDGPNLVHAFKGCYNASILGSTQAANLPTSVAETTAVIERIEC
jgi:hypothetical protein